MTAPRALVLRTRRRGPPGLAVLATALLAALAGCGGAGPAERSYAKSLAALRAGDGARALSAADEAAARGGPAYAALRDFVRGNVAFARSAAAEAAADRAGAEATLLDRAIADAEDALSSWRSAATSRDDWPEARRNVERAILRMERLRRKQADLQKGPPPTPDQPPAPKPEPGTPPIREPDAPPLPPPPPLEGRGVDSGEPPKTDVVTSDLPAGDVLRILDVLAEKEKQKLSMRRAQRSAKTSDVERDW